MDAFEEKYLLSRRDYGLLYPYIVDEEVTDINWNGRQLWIDHLKKGDRKSTRLNSSHLKLSRMPSSA